MYLNLDLICHKKMIKTDKQYTYVILAIGLAGVLICGGNNISCSTSIGGFLGLLIGFIMYVKQHTNRYTIMGLLILGNISALFWYILFFIFRKLLN